MALLSLQQSLLAVHDCAQALQGSYYEAAVTSIDAAKQVLTANFPKHAGLEQYNFEVPYDILIYSVGSTTNTFGIQVHIADLLSSA